MATSIDGCPVHSTLEIWTESEDGDDYETPASLVAGDPAYNRRWQHPTLANAQNSPPTYGLERSGAIYIVRFFTNFQATAAVDIKLRLRVRRPDGTVFGNASKTINGKKSDADRIDFFGVSVAS